ncbi:hypothetical protein W97_05040 [Coniosporium apollinis CBS 100218]|uniref:PNPLA domain-containing protein n=1 Tax=Coniosporium apollinis (strain CBS 100218) TaxID=1168221 RepID=R7YVV8_CONA1|nr:uncharacterized protein W97_05040 [Coniosporium apollinis CBS 100218]EON65801.1 hypothetical protein W97_05040 [Coniosporium apollinis CBS 100218]
MPSKDLRLLALDGGGIRGLSSLMILEQLMQTIDPDSPPKPCEYFDMIGGTSTGGLIAIMLGRLRMGINECIDAYLSLSDRVFRKKRHRVTMKGQIQGRFDSDELARAVKEIVKRQGLQEDALLKDAPDASCKVFVCATSKETSETVCLTSYKSPRGGDDLLNTAKIWEACRATSAASSFFDPISIGRYGEEFIDGATGANNPAFVLWNQAQDIWGPEPLERNTKCLVSIGTGIPSLKPFRDDVFHIGETLIAISTETEQTAERFRRDKSHLDTNGLYYRFNVVRGLEDVGLEESKKRKEIAAATRRYVTSQDVFKQMQTCGNNLSGREYFGHYQTPFSLHGVPIVHEFVDRPSDMAEIERALLPGRHHRRKKIFIVHGLGGMGKTQLAVKFARKHHPRFSSVFWLDGQTENSLKQSIANSASRVPEGQIAEASRSYSTSGDGDINAVVKNVLGWLTNPDNTEWLLIFDNVDRDHQQRDADPNAYDVTHYFPGADHGSILVTTRLAYLEQLGASRGLKTVDVHQAHAIFQSRYGRSVDQAKSEELLSLLDGLPLALAQAASYLRETGIDFATYIKFYKQQWKDLMESRGHAGTPLHDYPNRSVWTTWTISFNSIRTKNEAAVNLLLLWAHLDNKDLWHGLFAGAWQRITDFADEDSAEYVPKWLRCMASNELKFIESIQLLRNYSLIEDMEGLPSYATHPVVHRWALYSQDEDTRVILARLAVIVVGWALPNTVTKEYPAMQRRLSTHAQWCLQWIPMSVTNRSDRRGDTCSLMRVEVKHAGLILNALNELGILSWYQGKLVEGENILQYALQESELAFCPEYELTIRIVDTLGIVYAEQGKLAEAELMHQRALQGREKALGPEHRDTLGTVSNLGVLYKDQGKLAEAELMLQRALQGREKALGLEHRDTLSTVNNLGVLYEDQGKLAEAELMYERALQGKEKGLGLEQRDTLRTVHNLGLLYHNQGKLAEAELMYQRALQGYEKTLGSGDVGTHKQALDAIYNLGDLYERQGKLAEAKEMFTRALVGYQTVFELSHPKCQHASWRIESLGENQGTMNTFRFCR